MPSDPQTRRLRERWQHLIGQFLVYGTHKGWSGRTLEAYGADLREWSQHLASNRGGLDQALTQATERFLQALRDRGNVPKSISRRITTLKSFGAWLEKSGAFPASPFRHLESPRLGKRLPRDFALTDEAKRILAACHTLRERVVMAIFLRTGLRLREFATVRVSDWRERTFRIIGKGNKEEITELSDDSDALLREWIASDEYRGTPSGWLLPGAKGDTHISASALYALVCRVTKRAGRRLHPHALRHSTATIMLESGEDIRVIQSVMRHASLNTTALYTHVVSRQKRKAAEDFPV